MYKMKNTIKNTLLLLLVCLFTPLFAKPETAAAGAEKTALRQTEKVSFRFRGRRAFFRNEKNAALRCEMTTKGLLKNLSVQVRIKGVRTRTHRFPQMDRQKNGSIRIPLETCLMTGSYVAEFLFRYTLNGKKVSCKIQEKIRIAPRENREGMPVILWGYNGIDREQYRNYQKIGFTVGMNYSSPCRIAINSSRFEQDVEKYMRHYDDVLCDGFAIGDFFYLSATAPFAKRYPRIGRDGKKITPVIPDASHPQAIAESLRLAEKVAKNFSDHPALQYTLINSEIRDRAQPSFAPHNRQQYKAFSGKTIPEEVESRIAPHYTRIKGFPFSRQISTAHPLYQYYKYYWGHGDGWNDLGTKVHHAYKKYMHKNFRTIHDPAVRVPPVWGSGGEVDVISHWTYAYPEPMRVAVTTMQTRAMAEGRKGQEVMNMTQLFGYRQVLAPSSVKKSFTAQWEKDHPKAKYITLPPDMLSIALWSQLSRETRAVMFHGLNSLLKPRKKTSSGYVYTHAGSLKVLQDFLHKAVHPLGPALLKVPERKTPVALLESFSSGVFAGRTTWGVSGWVFDASLAMLWANLGHRIVYEEALLRGDLEKEGIKILVLPGCDVLTPEVFAKLKEFQKKGGILVGDEFLVPNLSPDILWKSVKRDVKDSPQQKKAFQTAGELLRKELSFCYTPYTQSSNADLVTHARTASGSDYLFVINDKRTYGKYVGQSGHTMEKGLPNRGKVSVGKDSGAVYDLLAHKSIPFVSHRGKTTLDVSLKGGEGRVYLILDQKIASLDLSIQGNSGKGNMVTLKAELKDPEGEPVRGVVPLELTVLDPKGRKTDESFFTSAVDGKFRHTLRIPLNTPPGKWTAVIRSLADNRSVKKHF